MATRAEAMREMYEGGSSIAEVAAHFECSRGYATKLIRQAGGTMRGKGELNRIPFDTATAAALYIKGQSIPQIAKQLRATKSTVRLRLHEAGISMRSATEGMTMAKREGRGISPMLGKFERTPEIRAKQSQSMRNRPAAGVSLKPSGYLELTRGHEKHRSVHRVVMERHLGRRLHRDEVVHHVDHDRANNRIENLQVMTRAEHARHHIVERIAAGERIGAHLNKKPKGSPTCQEA